MRSSAAVDITSYFEKGFPTKVVWFRKFFTPKHLNLRNDSCMNRFSEYLRVGVCSRMLQPEMWLVPCCHFAITWMDLTSCEASTKYYDRFFFLHSQQVNTIFSCNFHMWLLLYLSCKAAINWRKSIYDPTYSGGEGLVNSLLKLM